MDVDGRRGAKVSAALSLFAQASSGGGRRLQAISGVRTHRTRCKLWGVYRDEGGVSFMVGVLGGAMVCAGAGFELEVSVPCS